MLKLRDVAVLGVFLFSSLFFKVSGLTGGRENWLWERQASGGWDESLGEDSWVQDSSQMPKEAGRLTARGGPARAVPRLTFTPFFLQLGEMSEFPTDRPWSTLR